MPRIPDLPGNVVPRNSDQERWLKAHVAKMCRLDHDRYWVCEKSDGVRVLFLICTNLDTCDQAIFIIDRHNTYRELTGLFFPHYDFPERPLRNTLLDAELVVDTDPVNKQERLRLLTFDCLVVDDQNVMSKHLDNRYGKLREWFYKPYSKMIKEHPHVLQNQPFEIVVKEINLSYHLDKVFNVDIPKLQHGNDGLIYTCVNTPYVTGTDHTILKWKPPHENSIDFKLVLRFPPTPERTPDFYATPLFLLHVWTGGDGAAAKYEPFDMLHVEDAEWEAMKESGEQIDDRIIEVHWDPDGERWRMMRFRNDKPHGNHRSVVEKIIQSIADGVQKDVLLARSTTIRNNWKTRLARGGPSGSAPAAGPARQDGHVHAPAPVHAADGRRFSLPGASPIVELRYGPIASSSVSKVGGPLVVFGMNR